MAVLFKYINEGFSREFVKNGIGLPILNFLLLHEFGSLQSASRGLRFPCEKSAIYQPNVSDNSLKEENLANLHSPFLKGLLR